MSDQTISQNAQYNSNDDNSMMLNDEDNIEDMYLTFGVSGEEYGIGIGYVTEVVGMQRIMDVPDVPPFIKGVINLRGKIIPVMDVCLRFGMASKEYTERTVIIVLDVDGVMTGLVVDHVSEVIEITGNNIDLPAKAVDSSSLVRGFGKHGDKVTIILDIEQLVR